MNSNFENSLAHVLGHEGGWSDHPSDPGGKTNYGITHTVYDAYRRSLGLLPRSVRYIERKEVVNIYYQQYWVAAGCDKIPLGLDYIIFDGAVNSGPKQSVIWLQRCIQKLHPKGKQCKVDGQLGIVTYTMCKDLDVVQAINNVVEQRESFYRRLGNFNTFGAGWLNRLLGYYDKKKGARNKDGVDDVAIAMAMRANVETPTQVKVAPPPMPTRKVDEVKPVTNTGNRVTLGAVLAAVLAALAKYMGWV